MRRSDVSAALIAAALAYALAPADARAQRADGEPSRTPARPAPTWKLAAYPAPRAAVLRYADVDARRLLEVERSNRSGLPKATQIGIARRAALEASARRLPELRWTGLRGGAAVARLTVESPDALALRVGLQLDRMDPRVELRFAGSDEPGRVVAAVSGAEMVRLRGDDGLFWTPATDGQAQVIEIYRPAGVPASAVRLQAPRLSHLLANSRNDFKLVEKIGESGACNVDTACRIGELGPRFVDAKNAVAHMVYVKDGRSYICTGTLLADTTPGTQVPYFYGANHCFSSGTPVPLAVQAVANTLNTYWNYEATACGSGVSTTRTLLVGGATWLYSDATTDGMLLRLNEPAPAGAFFAGWNAAPVAASSAVLAIHHPRGDAKKASLGQQIAASANLVTVGWTSGTTEGGSSGSGLFTLGRKGYELRGGLYGGEAACSNSGSLANTLNRDYYSRLDVLFPNVKQYLAAHDVPMDGSEPLLAPDTTAPASAPAASSAPAAGASKARPARSVEAVRRQRLLQR